MNRPIVTLVFLFALLANVACPVKDKCVGLYCACPCPESLQCGPNEACTSPCRTSSECQGGACLGGLCAIVCTPGGPDDCTAAGAIGAKCTEIDGANVCAYADTQ